MQKKLKSLLESDGEKIRAYWESNERFMCGQKQSLPNGIACPQCGNELLDTHPNLTLTSLPPKKDIHCGCCDYRGFRVA